MQSLTRSLGVPSWGLPSETGGIEKHGRKGPSNIKHGRYGVNGSTTQDRGLVKTGGSTAVVNNSLDVVGKCTIIPIRPSIARDVTMLERLNRRVSPRVSKVRLGGRELIIVPFPLSWSVDPPEGVNSRKRNVPFQFPPRVTVMSIDLGAASPRSYSTQLRPYGSPFGLRAALSLHSPMCCESEIMPPLLPLNSRLDPSLLVSKPRADPHRDFSRTMRYSYPCPTTPKGTNFTSNRPKTEGYRALMDVIDRLHQSPISSQAC